MKKLLVLGAGTAGTMVANRLVRTLEMDHGGSPRWTRTQCIITNRVIC